MILLDGDDLKTETVRTVFCVLNPETGNLSNHHYTATGAIGKRVTAEDATHFITTLCVSGKIKP